MCSKREALSGMFLPRAEGAEAGGGTRKSKSVEAVDQKVEESMAFIMRTIFQRTSRAL